VKGCKTKDNVTVQIDISINFRIMVSFAEIGMEKSICIITKFMCTIHRAMNQKEKTQS